MCLGVPGRIVSVDQTHAELGIMTARVDVCGIQRNVDISCLATAPGNALVGRWVLVHVGFAMALLDEEQARATLEALEQMQVLAHELEDFSGLERSGGGLA